MSKSKCLTGIKQPCQRGKANLRSYKAFKKCKIIFSKSNSAYLFTGEIPGLKINIYYEIVAFLPSFSFFPFSFGILSFVSSAIESTNRYLRTLL